jgi:uncharacterized RmlC-like cupin family protein
MPDQMPDTCQKLRLGETYAGKQGFDYFQGIARETTGARSICMHMLRIPPGGRAKAHLHAEHETAIYVIDGRRSCTGAMPLNTRWKPMPVI